MKLFRILPLVVGSALFVGVQKSAQALTFNTYTDLASLQAAAGSTTTENFNSLPTQSFTSGATYSGFNGFNLTATDSTTGNPATIRSGVSTGNIDGTNFLGWGNVSGTGPTIIFTSINPVNAFAFNYVNVDNTDRYKLTVSGTDFLQPLGYSSSGFFGIVADTSFSVATISQTASGGFNDFAGIDNVSTAAAAVPFDIPGGATIPAVGGLLALGLMRKARKSIASNTRIANPVTAMVS